MPVTGTVAWAQSTWDPTERRRTCDTPLEVAERLLTQGSILQAAARRALVPERQRDLGQYFTPMWVARLMASMAPDNCDPVRILDPGAGAGTLFTAYVAQRLRQDSPPRSISVTAFELDPAMRPFLQGSADAVRRACELRSVPCEVELRFEDFAQRASREWLGHLFSAPETFDAAILNPPYRKLSAGSDLRARLDALGIAAPNLYAAFVGLALAAVKPGGTVVAILPRSFCNGVYFRRFRRYLLGSANVRRVHLFSRRDRAFGADAVLQENVVLALQRGGRPRRSVSLSFSDGSEDDPVWSWGASSSDIVRRDDSDLFVHLPESAWSVRLSRFMTSLPASLSDLGIDVSTGPVVGFRMKKWFAEPGGDAPTAPLLHPVNFRRLDFRWPVEGNKPQALALSEETERVLIPAGWYVVTRRFTTKEEARRVVASVIDPSRLPGKLLALENHLNYVHKSGRPIERELALGLATYLNSTFVDRYFRQFSGHTQVNATDLRRLKYPSLPSLLALGSALDTVLAGERANQAIRQHCTELCNMPDTDHVEARIQEGLTVLRDLGMPREQQNERSALTLLTLAGLTPTKPWADSSAPLMGVTPIMEWVASHYGREYAPNTRETFRRFTLHQFVDAGLVVPNPDRPNRAVNSPKYCYQIDPEAMALLRTFGSAEWPKSLARYLSHREALSARYAQRRKMAKIPLVVKEGVSIALTPGGQNELVRVIVEEFCPLTHGRASGYYDV